MNLISVTAAMGVLTFVFQEGHFSDLLGFTANGFIDGTIPVVIFAGLFGLSMDYEVFLLTRIREEYAHGRDNTGAVAAGMERTGQIITSAALILVVVVGSLAISHLALNKALGLTFAVAVLLDATLIRLLLVPAFPPATSKRAIQRLRPSSALISATPPAASAARAGAARCPAARASSPGSPRIP